MTNNFKSSTDYHFTKEDYDFIASLSKIGFVHILSSQVVLIDQNASSSSPSEHWISSKGWSTQDECEGLTLPEGWVIESVGVRNGCASIGFAVKHK